MFVRNIWKKEKKKNNNNTIYHHLPSLTDRCVFVATVRSCPSPDHRRRQWGDWMIRISHLDDGHGAETGLIDDDDLWFPQLSINFYLDVFWSSDFVISSKSPVSMELFRYLVVVYIYFFLGRRSAWAFSCCPWNLEPGWFHLVPRPSQRSRDINQEIST